MRRQKILVAETTDNVTDAGRTVSERIVTSWSQRQLFLVALMVRFVSVILTQSYFVPDEYWQSTEVAHSHVFGYGYLTWEWHKKIRSYLHPLLFEIIFLILKLLHMDYACIVIYSPHFVQAIITAYCDTAVYKITYNLFHDKEIALNSYLLMLSSWFIFYTGSRTLSNTAEMCFMIIAVSHLKVKQDFCPDQSHKNKENSASLFLLLCIGGVSIIVRPTAFILWSYIMMYVLIRKFYNIKELFGCFLKVLPLMLLLSLGVDYYFYKEVVFVHWNFFKFNVAENLSGFYGVHPFHWYFSQGLPVTLFTHSAFVIVGFIYCKERFLFFAGMFYVIILSLIPHKEFRFLLPVLPLLYVYGSNGLKQLCQWLNVSRKNMVFATICSNIIPCLYFCLIHQRGVIDTMKFIRESISLHNETSVLFLMPCHSTPFYSYVHSNISMDILTCLPSNKPGYMDVSDVFYKQPQKWFADNLPAVNESSHIVAFNQLPKEALWMLRDLGFNTVASFFHTHFPEGRTGSRVNVYMKRIGS